MPRKEVLADRFSRNDETGAIRLRDRESYIRLKAKRVGLNVL